jgi:hypothetical protein
VKGAADQLTELLGAVTGVGSGSSLAEVKEIQADVAASDKTDACGSLTAFISEVKAQTGKKLNAKQAASFIQRLQNIEAALGCKTGHRERKFWGGSRRSELPRPIAPAGLPDPLTYLRDGSHNQDRHLVAGAHLDELDCVTGAAPDPIPVLPVRDAQAEVRHPYPVLGDVLDRRHLLAPSRGRARIRRLENTQDGRLPRVRYAAGRRR